MAAFFASLFGFITQFFIADLAQSTARKLIMTAALFALIVFLLDSIGTMLTDLVVPPFENEYFLMILNAVKPDNFDECANAILSANILFMTFKYKSKILTSFMSK